MKKIIIIALVALSAQAKAQTQTKTITNADDKKIAELRAEIKREEENGAQTPIVLNPRQSNIVTSEDPNKDGRGSSVSQKVPETKIDNSRRQQQIDEMNAAKSKSEAQHKEMEIRIKATNESGTAERK